MFLGLPCDWLVSQQTPQEQLKAALGIDSGQIGGDHPLLNAASCHTETVLCYAPAAAAIAGVDVPLDGTHIATIVLGLLPTSRGSITLRSKEPPSSPCIDPNYYATKVDRVVMHDGIRQALRSMEETPEGPAMVEGEMPPSGFAPLL